MICSGCGKDIPFNGEVCPYCLRDKKSDQAGTVAGSFGIVIGGFIGYLVADFIGMLVGGLVLGSIVAVISLSGSSHSAKKPPRVRVATTPSSTTKLVKKPEPAIKPDDRLRQLQALKIEGLISEEEFQQKRATIIAAI